MQGPPAPRPAILGTSPTLDKAAIHNVLLTIGCNSALHCHRQMAYSSHRIPTALDQISDAGSATAREEVNYQAEAGHGRASVDAVEASLPSANGCWESRSIAARRASALLECISCLRPVST